MTKKDELTHDVNKLFKKQKKTDHRVKKINKEAGDLYNETKFSTPKEQRKGHMLFKKAREESNRAVRRSERFAKKHPMKKGY